MYGRLLGPHMKKCIWVLRFSDKFNITNRSDSTNVTKKCTSTSKVIRVWMYLSQKETAYWNTAERSNICVAASSSVVSLLTLTVNQAFPQTTGWFLMSQIWTTQCWRRLTKIGSTDFIGFTYYLYSSFVFYAHTEVFIWAATEKILGVAAGKALCWQSNFTWTSVSINARLRWKETFVFFNNTTNTAFIPPRWDGSYAMRPLEGGVAPSAASQLDSSRLVSHHCEPSVLVESPG